ncbi:MAG TPA: hypothetical protein VGP06_17315 [Janthinobacterium sp.]|nr:hypothetical protein [Janthinobacterium sp.]
MKKIHFAIIAVFSAAALAANAGAGAQTPEAKTLYAQSKDAAAATYKTARARCNSITGNPKDVCIAQAKAARVHTESAKDNCVAAAKAQFGY